MKPFTKGVLVAVLQLALVASLGAKLLYDRATLPRVWAQAAPFDPSLPIRGRYVRLQLAVQPRGLGESKGRPGAGWQPSEAVVLKVEQGALVADPKPEQKGFDPSALHVRFLDRQGQKLAVLAQPVPFFIPEHVPDPSLRKTGEELWVEVTIPRKGPPRPIRLGVRKGNGPILPLAVS